MTLEDDNKVKDFSEIISNIGERRKNTKQRKLTSTPTVLLMLFRWASH